MGHILGDGTMISGLQNYITIVVGAPYPKLRRLSFHSSIHEFELK